MTQKFVDLPNGVVLDASQIAFIAQSGLNEYHVFFVTPGPVNPKLDRANFEALREYLGAQKLVAPPDAVAPAPVVIAKS